jgi:exodeoxyribonuclease V
VPRTKEIDEMLANGQIIRRQIQISGVDFIINPVGVAGEADLIILDECSMIDKAMADDLRSFNTPILVMGDPGQLPPVNGEGSFTNRQPDFFLDEIHRQAADSPIIELATMARQGIALPVGYSKNGVKVVNLTNAAVDEHLHNPDTQVLCGLNRIRWAVTQIMRRELGFGGDLPLPGEKILCVKNNKKEGLFNGSCGILDKLDIAPDGAWRISGLVEDRHQKNLRTDPFMFRQHFDEGASQRNYGLKCPNEFDWGYVWSVHKAQGSGWPHVTLIDNSGSFRENKWKHLYTGITRAESGLTVLMGA